MDESQRKFASEDEEATWCLSILRDGDRNQKIVARERLSQIFEHRGLLDEVAQCLESNIREGVRDPRVYQRLAGIYRRQGRHELADEVLQEARRLAERGARPQTPPTGPRPIRGGRPPQGGRRPEPPPHPLEAATAPMKATAATTPPFVPIPPPPASPSARGELSLDAPRAASDEPEVKVIDRPWWVSPPAIVLGLLLCGPFGAFVVAAMWVRGGYTKRAKITAAVVWAGLMILQGAAVAISFQAMVAGMLADTGRLTGLPLTGATATPLVFSTPAAGAVSSPQAVVPKPAGAVASPAAGASGPAGAAPPPPGGPPGAGPVPQTSPVAAAPSQGTVVPPPGAQGQPTGERLRVIDTGGSGANVRERPGSTAPIAKTVPDGAILVVVGADQQVDGRGWRNVRDSEGISGWVAAELVEPAR